MIDTTTPRSPGWWLEQLERRLNARNVGEPLSGRITGVASSARNAWLSSQASSEQRRCRPGLDLLDSYLRGDPPLPACTEGWTDAMRPFFRLSRTNMADLVVSAPLNRMNPLGWATQDDDRDGDEVAAAIALANNFAGKVVPEVFEWALALGDGYMIVGPGNGVMPRVTAEDPRQVITAEDPATGETLAGLKVYQDEWTGDDVAHVFTPGRIDVATRSLTGMQKSEWSWDPQRSGALPAGFEDIVVVERFTNRRSVGEFEPHLDLLDRINDTIFQRIVISKYQAFRQRATIGMDTEDPDSGVAYDLSEVLVSDPGAWITLPEGTEMWESGTVDLTGLLSAAKDDVSALAAVTGTPLFYLTPDAANGSAEGASLMREGLVYRVEDRRRRFEARLARVMSLCFRFMGDTARADASHIRTLWQPAERFSLAERMSASAQAKVAGLPQEAIWMDVMQYGPGDLPRLESSRAADLLFADLTDPAPVPAPSPAPVPA